MQLFDLSSESRVCFGGWKYKGEDGEFEIVDMEEARQWMSDMNNIQDLATPSNGVFKMNNFGTFGIWYTLLSRKLSCPERTHNSSSKARIQR